jgi:hypothetical protein
MSTARYESIGPDAYREGDAGQPTVMVRGSISATSFDNLYRWAQQGNSPITYERNEGIDPESEAGQIGAVTIRRATLLTYQPGTVIDLTAHDPFRSMPLPLNEPIHVIGSVSFRPYNFGNTHLDRHLQIITEPEEGSEADSTPKMYRRETMSTSRILEALGSITLPRPHPQEPIPVIVKATSKVTTNNDKRQPLPRIVAVGTILQ